MTDTCTANVGAGPFEVVCRNRKNDLSSFYRSGSTPTITLQPNPNYFGKHPRFRVTMPVIATNEVNWKQYLAGGIDIVSVPTVDIKKASKMKGFVKAPSSAVFYMTVDSTTPPFNNQHCRLAVAYAIDQATIDGKVLHGAFKPLYDVVPKGMPGWYPGSDNPHYNPALAKSQLAQCPGGIKNVEADYPAGSGDTANEMAALQAMWSSVGIGITPKEITLNDWYTAVSKSLGPQNIKMVYNGWIMDYDDPQDYVTNLLHSGSNYDIGGFSDKTFDRLADKADVTTNVNKRMALYRQAQHIAVGGGYWINLGQEIAYWVVNPKIHGLVGTLQGLEPMHNDWSTVTVK
jgi:ABC-type oligopeptide transport system substrate-binding subunit